MTRPRIFLLSLALQFSFISFCQHKDSFAVIRPDRYRLDLPKQWDRNKLIEAITEVLSQTIDELKNREFCTDCLGGYTVRVAMDSITVSNSQTSAPTEIASTYRYTCSFDYSFYASLQISDSTGKPFTKLRLFATDEILNYSQQFSVRPQNATYRMQNVTDSRGRVVARRRVQEAPAVMTTTPQISPFSILTESFLLDNCEKRIHEIRKILKKINQD